MPKKHKKRRWRKEIDASDVQDAMLKKSVDLLAGGELSVRPDSALFVMDKPKGVANFSLYERVANALPCSLAPALRLRESHI